VSGPLSVAQQTTISRMPANQSRVSFFETELLINRALDAADDRIILR